MVEINTMDYNYTYQKLIQIISDTIGLYLIINKDTANRAKLTTKTILTSLQKQDFDTFYKYYDIFKAALFNVKSNSSLSDEEINNREVAFGLLTQIKLLLDNDLNIQKSIVEKRFCSIGNEDSFYLFKIKDTDTFVSNHFQIESKEDFRKFCHKIVCECASEFLKKYF